MKKKLLDIDSEVLFHEEIGIEQINKMDIAVIGISGRFGPTNNVNEYWNAIKMGKDLIGELSQVRKKDTESIANKLDLPSDHINFLQGAFLDEIDKFDYKFFNISPREASLMDPNQRIFLQTAWEAIEDAGYGGDKIKGSNTGVFVGYSCINPSYENVIWKNQSAFLADSLSGNLSSILASRIAYILDMKGPCILVDTACSSSLVSIHLACQSIKAGECDMALAGGINLMLMPVEVKGNEQVGINSHDGKTRTFDDKSDGTGMGEGVGAVLLKPLSKAIKDNDYIYAIIKGSAINNDGNSVGITAPNANAQKEVMLKAWEDAKINPEEISYIEAHGTGTVLGDPIEIYGIEKAFEEYTQFKQFCAIGSVKTNIGHLNNAAGIAGFIKAVLALNNKQIPPLLHFRKPNNKIAFEESPVYINTKLRYWEVNKCTRKCGISSFGLSGTNCHMVLEEAPKKDENKDFNEHNNIMFTLSSKNNESLNALIQVYISFLNDENNCELQDIAYIQNTGRGHYTHRVAIVVKNKVELKEKLEMFLNSDMNSLGEKGIYFGIHKIVPESKKTHDENDITENEKTKLTIKANDRIDKNTPNDNLDSLNELCQLYSAGAELDWNKFYDHYRYKKVRIPTYQFKKTRCWISNEKVAKPKNRALDKYNNVLLGNCVMETIDEKIYSSKCSTGSHWLFNEHKILGKSLLVGTAYFDWLIQAYMDYNHKKELSRLEVRDLILSYPLIINEEDNVEVHTIIRRLDNSQNLTIASKQEDTDSPYWSQHAVGQIYSLDKVKEKKYNVDDIIGCCNEKVIEINEVYNKSEHIEVSERWNVLKKVFVGKKEMLGYLEINPEFKDDLDKFKLYPPMLDCAIHLGLSEMTSEDSYFPFYFETVKIYRPIEECIYSYVKLKEKTQETIIYDITLLNKNGDVIIDIENYTMKKNSVFSANNDEKFYSIKWSVEHNNEIINYMDNECILMFKGKNQLSDRMTEKLQKGNKIIEISIGNCYEKIDNYNYCITNCEEDYIKLLNDLKEENISKVIHLLALENYEEVSDLNKLKSNMKNGFYSIFYLTKALIKNNINKNIDFYAIAPYVEKVNGSEKRISPENAALFGIMGVLEKEYSNLKSKCIDIDKDIEVDLIIEEICSAKKQSKVAFRNGIRYVEEFSKENIEEKEDNLIRVKENGVYVITGGTGGIGLEISNYLATIENLNIVLINRSTLPPRNEWHKYSKENSKIGNIIKKINEIERKGSNVICYSADIANMEEVSYVIDELKDKYGKINGIIHSAGIAGDGFIVTKNEDVAQEVLKCKVEGTWILNELTKNEDLDLFVMCSSINSILIGEGQSDYTAANSYLDSFSDYRSLQNKKTLTINWAAWNETGMAFEYGVSQEDIFKPLTTKQAIDRFNIVINKNISRVVIGELNYSKIANFPEEAMIRCSKEIKKKIDMNRNYTFNNVNTKLEEVENNINIILNGKMGQDYTLIEREISQVWAQVLGLEEINVYDSFYDLGGDSIFAMKIVNKINKELSFNITIMDVLNYQSIYELAKYVTGKEDIKNDFDSARLQDISLEDMGISEYYPVSSSEKRLFIINQFEDIGISYNVPMGLKIEGEFNKDKKNKFEEIINKIIARHQVLRTNFEEIDGEIYQKINNDVVFKLEYIEPNKLNKGINELIKEFIRPFDLSNDLLIRGVLIKIAENEHVLLIDLHHIITDWTSTDIFIYEFVNLYNGIEIPKLEIQYKDYCIWQNKLLQEDGLKKQREYWVNELLNYDNTFDIPTDYPRPPLQSYEGDKVSSILDEETTKKIYALAETYNTTVFMIMTAAHSILFSKFIGNEDIIIGSPISGRVNEKLNNMMGMFVNMLPIRYFIRKESTFEEHLSEVKKRCLQAFKNQEYPYELLIDDLNMKRNLNKNLLFDVAFSFFSTKTQNIDLGDLSLKPYDLDERSCKFDIGIDVVDMQHYIEIVLRYKVDLFKRKTMESYMDYYKGLIEMIIENPKIKVRDMEVSGEQSEHDLEVNNFEEVEFSF